MVSIRDVDIWVDRAATMPIRRFYPSVVANAIDLPLADVFKRLLFLASDDRIILKFEVRCPCYECGRTTDMLTEMITNSFFSECDIHGEFEVTPEMLYPVFEFDPEYKSTVTSQKKKKMRLIRKPLAIL